MLRGIADMKLAFAQLGEDFDGKSLPRIMRKTAARTRGLAKLYVPVDEGRLRDSIKVRRLSKKKAAAQGLSVGFLVVPAAPKGAGADGQELPSNYGAMVELGTEKQKAQPFLRPAADEVSSQINTVVRQEMAADLKRTSARIARALKKAK